MENPLGKGSPAPKFNIEDLQRFGKLLSDSRIIIHKTHLEIAKETGFSSTEILKWEDSDGFPGEVQLPVIAKCYRIGLGELVSAFRASKQARKIQVADRRIMQNKDHWNK